MGAVRDELVACRECGCVHQEATELVARLRADIRNLEADLRGKRSRLAEMRGQQAAQAQGSPEAAVANQILLEWRRVLAPKTRELNGARLEKTLARLRGGYTADQLRQCIAGYARRPYVIGNGRRSPVGKPSERRVDAELIFRDAQHVDTGIALELDESSDWLPLEAVERVPWRRVQQANRRVIVAALERQFGGGLDDGAFMAWPCPRCDNHPAATLQVAPVGYSWLAACSSCGLTEDLLLGAVR